MRRNYIYNNVMYSFNAHIRYLALTKLEALSVNEYLIYWVGCFKPVFFSRIVYVCMKKLFFVFGGYFSKWGIQTVCSYYFVVKRPKRKQILFCIQSVPKFHTVHVH